MAENLTNWAANHTYKAARIHRPETVSEVQGIVANASRVKALGTKHSFSTIADTEGDHLSLENLNRILSFDREQRTVTVEAGVRYGELGAFLHREGFALHNLASLPHISVAGACATATHGSGDRNGNLATAVVALDLVTADGSLVRYSRREHPDRFPGVVVHLGALGVVTALTLEVEPAVEYRQDVFEDLPFEALEHGYLDVTSTAYSVSLFTDWARPFVNQVWVKSKANSDPSNLADPTRFGARRADDHRHPIGTISPVNCTAQMGIPGPWHERLPHFRMEYTPSSGEELQSEFFVPRRHAWPALQAIAALADRVGPLLQISEIRTVAADDLWMSPCYQQDCLGIHFTWKKDWEGVRALLPTIEASLAPFEARPHWGKLFTMPSEAIRPHYPRLAEFKTLAQELDPDGKFRNAFMDEYLF